MTIHARVSDNVGGLTVHRRPASAILVEPKELNPGYHVELTATPEYRGKQHVWVEIAYVFDNARYTGWVIKEDKAGGTLDIIDVVPPPDIEWPLPPENGKPVEIPVPPLSLGVLPWLIVIAVLIGAAVFAYFVL